MDRRGARRDPGAGELEFDRQRLRGRLARGGRRRSGLLPGHAMILHNLIEPPRLIDLFRAHPPEGFMTLDLGGGTPGFSTPFDLLTTAPLAVRRTPWSDGERARRRLGVPVLAASGRR